MEIFSFDKYKNNIVYSKEDILSNIKKLDFMNKKIIDIAMVGNDYLLNKTYFVNWYNNKEGIDLSDTKKAVTKEDFNDNDLRPISVCTEYPIILKFEDNTTLELLFTLEGKYCIAMNKIPFDMKAECGNNKKISELFKDIKDSKIIDYKITDLTEEAGSYLYVNQETLTGTPIHTFELFLDNGLSIWFCHDSIYLKGKDDFIRINFSDYIKCIPNNEKYFSKQSIDRYTKEQKEEMENHEEPEIDAIREIARFIGYNKNESIQLLIYLLNNRDNVINNINKFFKIIKENYSEKEPTKEEFDKLIHKIFD